MNDTKVKIDVQLNSLKDLQKALKETKDEMVGLDAGSDAFRKAANKAGELKHQIDEINQSVRGASADFGDMVGNISKAGAGITGAFQAAQGALSLFGAESEDVTKAIAKMQSMMALTQGLAAIDQGIKGFRKFTTAVTSGSSKIKTALISTGFGALAIVLGSIIANWEEFTKAIGLSEKQMSKFGEVASGVMNVLKGSLKTLTQTITKVVTGDFKGAFQTVKDGFDIKKLYAEGVTAHIEEIKAKAAEDAKKIMQAAMEARWQAYYEELQREEDEASAAAIRKKLAEEVGGPTSHDEPVFEPLKREIEEEGPEFEKWLKDKLGAISFANAIIGDQETFLEQLDNQQAILDEYLNKGLISEQKYNKASNELAKQRAVYHAQAAAQAMQGISQIFNSLADMEDGQTKESFEKQKGLQIAGATMNMLGGITAAISGLFTTKSGPWDIALAAIQAAAIAASGIANIAKIKQQKFDGSGSNVSSARASISTSALTAASPVQYTQDIQGASIESALKDTRVYVTEADITNTQHRVNVAESESRF